MNTTRRPPIVAAIAIMLVLAACGGEMASSGPGDPGGTSGGSATQTPGGQATQPPGGPATEAPGPAAPVDGCSLLTEADIEAVTGHKVMSATGGPQFGIFPSGCEWELADADAIVPPSIGLGVMTAGGKAYYERYFEPYIAENGQEPIENLGDAAIEDEAGSVMVLSGDAFFSTQYIAFTDDDTAIAAELARKVIPHLGG
jgi:Protein of unknown function (DUF3558)